MKIGRYTESQWIALISTARLSSTLSIIGSTTIVFMVLRRKSRLALLQNRLLLVMSLIDILNSANISVSTAAHPDSDDGTTIVQVYGAHGTHDTCTAQGFLFTQGLSVPLYNSMLCINYLLVIRYNVKEDKLAKIEPFMHSIALLMPLAMAITGVITDSFHSTGGILCWLQTKEDLELYVKELYPDNKSTNSSDDDSYSTKPIMNILIYITCIVCLSIIVVSMVLIYRAVNTTVSRTNQNYLSFRRNSNRNRRSQGEEAPKETLKQAFIYVSAYTCTYAVSTYQFLFKDLTFVPSLLVSIFLPLQGVWNCVAFCRPRYKMIKEKFADQSSFFAMKIMLFSSLEEEQKKKRTHRSSELANRLNNIRQSRKRDESSDEKKEKRSPPKSKPNDSYTDLELGTVKKKDAADDNSAVLSTPSKEDVMSQFPIPNLSSLVALDVHLDSELMKQQRRLSSYQRERRSRRLSLPSIMSNSGTQIDLRDSMKTVEDCGKDIERDDDLRLNPYL